MDTAISDNDEILRFGAAGDAAEQIMAWLDYLISERRVAAKTVEAYTRDIT